MVKPDLNFGKSVDYSVEGARFEHGNKLTVGFIN